MRHPNIEQLRKLVRALSYVVSIHAAEELEDDNLTVFDLENIVLTGKIVEWQRDRKTREIKGIIHGLTVSGLQAEIIAKIGADGRLFVITVYLA